MKQSQTRPRYLKPEVNRQHVIVLPYVDTCGAPNSPYEWNNGAHAAVHSILAALNSNDLVNVHAWLETAKGQLDDAVVASEKRYAKVPQNPEAVKGGK